VPDDIKPPDWENPPCPACFAFDETPVSPEGHTEDLRKAYAAGLASGFLMCRMKTDTWRFLCPAHHQAVSAVIDAVCADHDLPREKVYADFGIPLPEQATH
jgi:hypothetical protein